MKPTMHLRFVRRDGRMVLQQWWEEVRDFNTHFVNEPAGEWRDVPTE